MVGDQRLPLEKLRVWEAAGFGMFIHFGMSTFVGEEMPSGLDPAQAYRPESLDVDGWVRLAKEAGMKYVVLTAKHVAGHCLWSSPSTDYDVDNSGNSTDVVSELANACAKHSIGMGLYYCSWDNHHRFGTATPSEVGIFQSHATQEYIQFQLRQLEELLTGYGPVFELWIDIPQVLGQDGRQACYQLAASLQPDTFVVMNQGCRGSSELDVQHAFPTDISTRERQFPECARWGQGSEGITVGHLRWYEIENKRLYIPTEVCDCIGYNWFHVESDPVRSPGEISAMLTIARARNCNLLLNVPPDTTGRIPDRFRCGLLEADG